MNTAIATATNNRYCRRCKTFRNVELFAGNQCDHRTCATCRGRDSDVDKPVPEDRLIMLEEALSLIPSRYISNHKVVDQHAYPQDTKDRR